jgi:hypothetical protein
MVDLTAPFLANDQGDVSIYESLEDMVAQFEPTDALDGVHGFPPKSWRLRSCRFRLESGGLIGVW